MRNDPSTTHAVSGDARNWLLAFGLMALSLAVLIPAMAPEAGATVVAAVYPPWWTSPRAAAAAARSTDIVRFGASPFIIIVRAADPQTLSRLRANGAVLFLNPILGLCTAGKAT